MVNAGDASRIFWSIHEYPRSVPGIYHNVPQVSCGLRGFWFCQLGLFNNERVGNSACNCLAWCNRNWSNSQIPGLVTARTAMSPCRVMSSTRLEQILSQLLYKEIANDSGTPKGASASAASWQSSQRLLMVRDERYPALERMEPDRHQPAPWVLVTEVQHLHLLVCAWVDPKTDHPGLPFGGKELNLLSEKRARE